MLPIPLKIIRKERATNENLQSEAHRASEVFPMKTQQFVEYFRSFYGPNGIYAWKVPPTILEIKAGIAMLKATNRWADGDSVDREWVRDYITDYLRPKRREIATVCGRKDNCPECEAFDASIENWTCSTCGMNVPF